METNPTIVNELRVTLIQFDRYPTLIPDTTPLGLMSDIERYKAELRRLLTGARGTTTTGRQGVSYSVPWKTSGQHWERYHRFWMFYLAGAYLDDVDGQYAWENLVPFRVEAFARSPGGDCAVEGYFYPHGVAVVVNHYLKDLGATLAETVQRAWDVMEVDSHDIEWFPRMPAPQVMQDLDTRDIVTEAFPRLHQTAFGQTAPTGIRTEQPLTVVTVLDAVPGADALQLRNLAGVLEALCIWERDASALNPRCLSAAVRSSRHQDDVLYLCKRGSTVWLPSRFAAAGSRKHREKQKARLNCYHRNLTFATLQTESLLNLLRVVRDGPMPVQPLLRKLGLSASRQLELLYGGKESTYRSLVLRHQIEAWVQDVNAARVNRLGLEAMAGTAPANAA